MLSYLKGFDTIPSFFLTPTSNTQSWGADYSNFVNASNPWLIRGGNSNNTTNAGVWASNNNTGAANTNNGFRVSLLLPWVHITDWKITL